jgi:heme exporter protein B
MSDRESLLTSVRIAAAILKREWGLLNGGGAQIIMSGGFYLTLCAMIPLSLGSDQKLLSTLAPGLSFLVLALSSYVSLDRLFERDANDGVFDLYQESTLGLEIIVMIKIFAHWMVNGLILSVLAPASLVTLGGSWDMGLKMLIIATLGSLSFVLIGAMGAGLIVGLRAGGGLLALMVLPLFWPPVIFGSEALGRGDQAEAGLGLLIAYALAALALCPLATALALRQALR